MDEKDLKELALGKRYQVDLRLRFQGHFSHIEYVDGEATHAVFESGGKGPGGKPAGQRRIAVSNLIGVKPI